MAILKNLWLRGAKQRMGGAVLYSRMGETIARELAPSVANPRTTAQMSQRVRLANVVNFYKVSAKWMRGAFESKAENQSDYNAFVAANLTASRVALTKSQAATGAAVVAPYKISQGSINPISWSNTGTTLPTSDLYVGDLTITGTTTVGQFSAALEEANNLLDGMQLSLIQYIQQVDAQGTPYVTCRAYEVVLNSANSQLLSSYMPIDILAVSTGANPALAVNTSEFTGGFALILSLTTGTTIKVSSANVILTSDNTFYDSFTTAAVQQAAIDSYGVGTEIFLSSANANQASTPSLAQSILYATIANSTYRAGDNYPLIAGYSGQSFSIKMAATIPADASVRVLSQSSLNTTSHPATDVTYTGDTITGTGYVYSEATYLRKLRVEINGSTFDIDFTSPDSGSGEGIGS